MYCCYYSGLNAFIYFVVQIGTNEEYDLNLFPIKKLEITRIHAMFSIITVIGSLSGLKQVQ